MSKRPSLWIISGPNGVGKTTYARKHIKEVTGTDTFINQDEIAKGIAPLRKANSEDLITAARISISQRERLLKSGKDFTIETTLSGKSYLRFIDKAKKRGYSVNLLYFFVNDIQESLRRIQRRVESGGHCVSKEDVERRFPRSMSNLRIYAKKCDHWTVFDNNGHSPEIVADFSSSKIVVRRSDLLANVPEELWNSMEELKKFYPKDSLKL